MSQCTTCGKPLVIEVDPEEEEEEYEDFEGADGSSETVLSDSVELSCGCLFHWCVFHKSILYPHLRRHARMSCGSMLTGVDVGNVY